MIDSGGLYGAEMVLLDLCSELRGMGLVPIVASIGKPGDGEKAFECAARARDFEVRLVRMAPGPNPRGAARLLRLARGERADVIHTHGYKGDILLGFVPRRWRGVPLVATVHGHTHAGGLGRMALYGRLDRLALRRADRVVLVHSAMAETPGLNRLAGGRCRVIENGIGPAEAESAEPLDPAIVTACEDRSLVIGAIGRLSREKGFDVLIRAAADLLRRRDDAVLVILGEGPDRGSLERLTSELGLSGRVRMPGYRTNAKRYLTLFHVLVLPSRTEGLPVALLEAMQAGVPIVASRVGGMPDALQEGLGGILVEPDNVRELASAIGRSLGDRESALGLAAHARSHVQSQFSIRAMAVGYRNLYDEVAAADRP